jgi:hypothetical protein
MHGLSRVFMLYSSPTPVATPKYASYQLHGRPRHGVRRLVSSRPGGRCEFSDSTDLANQPARGGLSPDSRGQGFEPPTGFDHLLNIPVAPLSRLHRIPGLDRHQRSGGFANWRRSCNYSAGTRAGIPSPDWKLKVAESRTWSSTCWPRFWRDNRRIISVRSGPEDRETAAYIPG